MPSKNAIKTYAADTHYHVYNRGVEKRVIFQNEMDYKVFLSYLKSALMPVPPLKEISLSFTLKGQTFKGIPKLPKNFFGKIDLVAYCLMPNHFHFLIKQNTETAMKEFLQSLSTRYSMYFNQKYHRVGALFQGRYKAVPIQEESYLLHLSRYIHLNPQAYTENLVEGHSSYGEYLQLRKTKWIKPDVILSSFSTNTNTSKHSLIFLHKVNTYKDFVESYREDSNDFLGKLTLEDEP